VVNQNAIKTVLKKKGASRSAAEKEQESFAIDKAKVINQPFVKMIDLTSLIWKPSDLAP
jgi:hypothetical protein